MFRRIVIQAFPLWHIIGFVLMAAAVSHWYPAKNQLADLSPEPTEVEQLLYSGLTSNNH